MTQQKSRIDDTRYRPNAVILVHEKQYGEAPENMRYYLEYAPIDTKGQVESYKPLRIADLSKLYFYLKSVQTEDKPRVAGVIPENLLYNNYLTGTFVWHVPAARRRILFTKESKMKNGFVNYPSMIFCVSENELYVYVHFAKDIRKIDKVFRMPFLNTYADDGNICLGDISMEVVKKAETFADLMQAWEVAFFESRFGSGAGGSQKFMEAIVNKRARWQTLIKNHKCKRVPFKNLML